MLQREMCEKTSILGSETSDPGTNANGRCIETGLSGTAS